MLHKHPQPLNISIFIYCMRCSTMTGSNIQNIKYSRNISADEMLVRRRKFLLPTQNVLFLLVCIYHIAFGNCNRDEKQITYDVHSVQTTSSSSSSTSEACEICSYYKRLIVSVESCSDPTHQCQDTNSFLQGKQDTQKKPTKYINQESIPMRGI